MYIALIAFAVVIVLLLLRIFKVPDLTWLTPVLISTCVLFLIVHYVLKGLRETSIYIFPTYFVLILIAPLLSSKIIYPYFISPRRFYASTLKLDRDPWHPPSGLHTFVLTQTTLIVYLLAVSYFILKLIALKRCGICKTDIVFKYAFKMATFGYVIYLMFRYSSILGAGVDLLFSWLPFAGDMVMGVPMAILCFLMLLFRYEEAVVLETNGTTLRRLSFWQNII